MLSEELTHYAKRGKHPFKINIMIIEKLRLANLTENKSNFDKSYIFCKASFTYVFYSYFYQKGANFL